MRSHWHTHCNVNSFFGNAKNKGSRKRIPAGKFSLTVITSNLSLISLKTLKSSVEHTFKLFHSWGRRWNIFFIFIFYLHYSSWAQVEGYSQSLLIICYFWLWSETQLFLYFWGKRSLTFWDANKRWKRMCARCLFKKTQRNVDWWFMSQSTRDWLKTRHALRPPCQRSKIVQERNVSKVKNHWNFSWVRNGSHLTPTMQDIWLEAYRTLNSAMFTLMFCSKTRQKMPLIVPLAKPPGHAHGLWVFCYLFWPLYRVLLQACQCMWLWQTHFSAFAELQFWAPFQVTALLSATSRFQKSFNT